MQNQVVSVDLFSGMQGWRTGKEIAYVGIDNNPKFNSTITKDIRKVTWIDIKDALGKFWGKYPMLLTASPVCTGFTVMQIGKNWDKCPNSGFLTPKSDAARLGLELLRSSLSLRDSIIANYPLPVYWIFENPRAAMRKIPDMSNYNMRTITYCQYPKDRVIQTMKPTDLWVCDFLESRAKLWWKEPCKNGSACHVSSPRGSTNGTQGMDSALAAKIPSELALAVYSAVVS